VTYRKQAREQTAVTSVPNGRVAYAALIHAYTTTRMTAEQIHQLGLQEVARIEKEMERLARADGFTGPVTEYEKQLGRRPGMRFTSQAEMIQYARAVVTRLQPALPKLFLRVPKMTVDVRPIPADREASTASNYTAGTADGTRPAWFNMNTYRPTEQVKYRTEALVLHETVPGHHLQIGIARELQGLPEFRKVFTAAAFSEGWGLYAESLGSELGVYGDPTDWRANSSAPFALSWTRGCTRWGGRAIARVSTSRCTCPVSRWLRSTATSHGRGRLWPTSSAS
jgi:prolyl oligopeptidase